MRRRASTTDDLFGNGPGVVARWSRDGNLVVHNTGTNTVYDIHVPAPRPVAGLRAWSHLGLALDHALRAHERFAPALRGALGRLPPDHD